MDEGKRMPNILITGQSPYYIFPSKACLTVYGTGYIKYTWDE